MAYRKTYPQHSMQGHGRLSLFIIALVLTFAIVFASSIPRAFALQEDLSEEAATVSTESVVSETIPVQMVPVFVTLSGVLAEADAAWANSQTDSAIFTNQTVPLVITQEADTLKVIGVASFVAIGLGALAIAFVMKRNDARRAKVLHI